ncbi:unnamed protein product [Symbiodinium sp. CCMP2456]|nr:unnamed protein product [Symbiodinium sp. CCMP2456]
MVQAKEAELAAAVLKLPKLVLGELEPKAQILTTCCDQPSSQTRACFRDSKHQSLKSERRAKPPKRSNSNFRLEKIVSASRSQESTSYSWRWPKRSSMGLTTVTLLSARQPTSLRDQKLVGRHRAGRVLARH